MSGPRTGLRAAVSAALFVCAAAGGALAQTPAAPAAVPSDASGVLPSGVAYTLRPDPAQPVAAVALWYRAPAGGFGTTAVPGLSRLAAATVTASTPITGTPLAQLVERWGGRISVAAYPDSVAITVLVPADHTVQTVRAMTGSFFAPVVAADGLLVAQRYATEDAIYRSLAPDAIEDALGTALFADGPLHDGTIGSARTVADIKLDRVRSFAERAFRPANAILVLTGNVDRSVLSSVASRAGATQSTAEAAAPQTPRAAPPPLEREGNLVGTGLGWVGPPITAEADATALDFLADVLFAPKTGTVSKALGTRKATVTGKFVTYHDPGVFLVTITGDDAAAARPIVEKAIADAAKPLSAAAFAAARAGFTYRILGQLATPADAADTYGWYTVEGDAAYAPAEGGIQGRYFTLAASLTPATVAQTAAKYLTPAPAVVTMKKAPEPKGART
ncbi:MAG: Peptidase inactive domain [Candidatus Eremiobacteraeota bacterium]|nr:Peptidase inactive domain [Candidatus Eremiobacteraeota bacterium]